MKKSKTLGSESIRILFVHNYLSRFVLLDRNVLSEKWDVQEWYQSTRMVNILSLIRAITGCDLVYGWFASWHTLLPLFLAHLMRKPSLLVVGGYDVANMPAINYGHQRGGLKKLAAYWSMNLATFLIPFSYSSQNEAKRNTRLCQDKFHVIYIGVPDLFWGISIPDAKKERIVLSVGNVEKANLLRKGHLPFVQSAALLPDVKFILIGDWKDGAIDELKAIASPNVYFAGRVSDTQLFDYYLRASVYVQASAHEGFGLSVAEAMLAGCIPVVTHAGSLPEVVGDCGFYAEATAPERLALSIQTALDSPTELRVRARNRILELFPVEKRKSLLNELVTKSVMKSKNPNYMDCNEAI